MRPGWINLDKAPLPGVDVVHDLAMLPLPFADGEFDCIDAKDVLEHLEYIDVLRDLHRILRSRGVLHIQVPHFTSADNYIDPTHRRRFSVRTFEFFVDECETRRKYYFDFAFKSITRRRLTFYRGPLLWNYVVEPLINSHSKIQKYYELTCLSRLFPAQNIEVTIEK